MNESTTKPDIIKISNDLLYNPETKPENILRVVCISDTHTETNNLYLPDGDILIHAGDFSYSGQPREVEHFANFMNKQPHKYKIYIAGNHDITYHKEKYLNLKDRYLLKLPLDQLDSLKTKFNEDIIYLEDSSVEILGYKIYGSPYSSKYYEWAFMKSEEKLKEVWNKIPTDTDILITHGPPLFIGDRVLDGTYVGSESLLNEVVNRIKPKLHIFGHIHEGYGAYILNNNPNTLFVNASSIDIDYDCVNRPVIIDLPMK